MPFQVQRELEDGELVEITIQAELEKAEALVRAFKEYWPGVYLITEVREGRAGVFHEQSSCPG